MKLKSVIVNDLYSFGPGVQCVFNYLDDNAKTLIIGVNNDEPGADSNGSGKSNLLNVIFWVLLGEVFQKENAEDMIRRGQKHGSGTLVLTDGEKDLVIERGRGKGVKKFLKLTYGGVSKTCDTDTATQNELYKLLNISPSLKPAEIINDFINTCYFSSDTVKGFMAKEIKSKQRFEVVERYLGLKRYTYASDEARIKKKNILDKISPILEDIAAKEEYIKNNSTTELTNQITTLETNRTTIGTRIAEHHKTIDENKERIELEKLIPSKTQALEDKRNAVMQQLNALEQELTNNNQLTAAKVTAISTYNTLKASVEEHAPEIINIQKLKDTLQTEITDINTSVTTLNTTIGGLNITINDLRNQLTNHYACPQCKTALMVKEKILVPVNVADLTKQLADTEQQRTRHTTAITNHNNRLTLIRKELVNHDLKLQTYTTEKALLAQQITAETHQQSIDQLTTRNQAITTQYNTLSAQAEVSVGAMKIELAALEKQLLGMPKATCNIEEVLATISMLQTQAEGSLLQIGRLTESIATIKKTEDALKGLHDKIAEHKREADMYGFWELGFRQIKMDIIDEFLPDFEDKVNDYLNKLKVNMRVDFDTQKRKATVSKRDIEEGREFKEEFNVTVYRGESLLPFGLLSKGQRSRVGGCVGMALRELTKERGNNLFDFFFLDEIADSLDESGLRELVSLLDEVPGQKLVISHNEQLKNLIEDTIIVEMTNETSDIRTVA